MPKVGTAVLDADDVLDAEMLGPKLPAERPARGLDGIADPCDQGNAKRVTTGAVAENVAEQGSREE